MAVTIYHNPRCSKSRQTLTLLRDRGIEPTIIDYLSTPPSVDELDRILTLLNKQPRDIIRARENEFKDAGFDDDSLSRQQLLKLMVANPKIIERPIVVANGQAAIGRPPESVLAIL